MHGQETMYLLDRLADLMHSANAEAGDMLMLTRDETGPVVIPPSLVHFISYLAVRGVEPVVTHQTSWLESTGVVGPSLLGTVMQLLIQLCSAADIQV